MLFTRLLLFFAGFFFRSFYEPKAWLRLYVKLDCDFSIEIVFITLLLQFEKKEIKKLPLYKTFEINLPLGNKRYRANKQASV